MSINIWLPIVLNVVSALIIVSSVLLALKRSLKVSIAKLIMVCGAIVACYFATPVHYEALNNIPFVAETLNNAGIILVDDVVIAIKSVLFIAAFGLSLIVVLSVTSISNSINVKIC